MLTYRGFSAWVTVEGQPVPEYLVAVDAESNRVSCWIPSEEGKTFAVSWRDHGGKVDTCSFLTLDGVTVPGHFLFGEGVATRQAVRTSNDAERPFMFQKAGWTDSPTAIASSKEVGMITLRIKRISRIGVRAANSIQEIPFKILGKRKAGDLCIGFGEETKSCDQYPSTWMIKPYDDEPPSKYPSTYVSFVFRYRSADFLESQGISVEPQKLAGLKRPLVRRVVSLPPTMSGQPVQPQFCTEPPRKKPRLSSNLPSTLKSQMNPPSGPRRTVSCKNPLFKIEQYPGQGLIVFENSSQERVSDSGYSSAELVNIEEGEIV